jgi:ZIP family zinc transporter
MEARAATDRGPLWGAPTWLLGLLPLALIALAIAVLALAGAPGLGERTGAPVEELVTERTVLRPGEIELTVRNDGPDPVEIAQVAINDAFLGFSASDGLTLDRLQGTTLTIPYDWIEGEAYEVSVVSTTGATFTHSIEAAAETPVADAGFFGLMAMLGLYVGVIPVTLGMLWLPFVRRIGEEWVRVLIAFTVGLLAFLAIDATLEGLEIADTAPSVFGGAALVAAGALIAFLALSAVDVYLQNRRAAGSAGTTTAVTGALRCWSRSGSASTTSARGWRSGPRTRRAPSRSGPSWWSASPSTTPPRASRSLPRWPRTARRSGGW